MVGGSVVRLLENLLRSKPELRDLPAAVIDGAIVSFGELLERAKSGDRKALDKMRKLGYDPEAEDYILAEEFWKRAPKDMKLYFLDIDRPITVEEAIWHIRAGDRVGVVLVKAYQEFRRRIAELVGGR